MLDLTPSELTSCVIAVQQKGDDAQECRQRVNAGLAVYAHLAPRAGRCAFIVVGGAAGDIGPALITEWCAGSGVEPTVLNTSHHTRDKAESIAAYVAEHRPATVIQVTSLYHSLRAYLTTRAALGSRPTAGLLNYVSDTASQDVIAMCVLDEILLAAEIEPAVRFQLDDDLHPRYVEAMTRVVDDPAHRTYLTRRHGEARRIGAYGEPGRQHLTTDIGGKELLATYLPWVGNSR